MHQLKDLMSRDVKVISPDMTITKLPRTMRDGDFGCCPSAKNDRMIARFRIGHCDSSVAEAKAPARKCASHVRRHLLAYDDDTVERAHSS